MIEENNFVFFCIDLLSLFFNHIRRSHSYKSGQCSIELIDQTCYYAQLAQLNLILNEIFDLLLNYKCLYTDIYPSNALKKCPLKRLFPMYYELILKPIDLTMIRNKLDNGEYLSYDSFEQDFLLLFNNAMVNITRLEYMITFCMFSSLDLLRSRFRCWTSCERVRKLFYRVVKTCLSINT